MKWATILFGYCTFATLFLFVSGIMAYQKNGNPFVLIVLAPVLGYFMYYLIRVGMRKESLPSFPASKNMSTFSLIILCALIAGAVYSIKSYEYNHKPATQQDYQTQ